jgi:hypothetical protein
MGIRINTHTPAQQTPDQRGIADLASRRHRANQQRESKAHSLDDHLSRRIAALEVTLQNQVAAESAVSDLAVATRSAQYIRSELLQTKAIAPNSGKMVPNSVLELLK